MNGSTKNTRLLGCGYLYPHVIPDPYTNTIALRNDDEFIVVANRGLWRYVTYTEAVEEVYESGNPVVAAKQLQDLAQAYGCKENISILVLRLNTDKGPSLARLRQHKSMSIDDVEAAVKHEARLQKHRQKMAAKERKESSGGAADTNLSAVVNGVVRRSELVVQNGDVVRGGGERGDKGQLEKEEEEDEAFPEPPPPLPPAPEMSDTVDTADLPLPPPPPPQSFIMPSDTPPQGVSSQVMEVEQISPTEVPSQKPPPPDPVTPTTTDPASPQTPPSGPIPPLKPLPKQRYLKKNAATEWEGILQNRLSQEVKDLEMKQLTSSVSGDELGSGGQLQEVREEEAMDTSVSRLPAPNDLLHSSLKRTVTRPWGGEEPQEANPAYSYSPEPTERSVIKMTETRRKPKVRGSIANTIAMFENMTSDPAEEAPARSKNIRSISVPRERERVGSPGSHRDKSPAPPAHKKSRSPPPVLMKSPPLQRPASPFQKGQPDISPSNRISRATFPTKTVIIETKTPSATSPKPATSPAPPKPSSSAHSRTSASPARTSSPATRPGGFTVQFDVPAQSHKPQSPPATTKPASIPTSSQGSRSKGTTNTARQAAAGTEETDGGGERANVSALVRMFGAGLDTPSKLNESVEYEHVDDQGDLHVFEVAKL